MDTKFYSLHSDVRRKFFVPLVIVLFAMASDLVGSTF
jgi:hypothetical protein